MVAWLVDLVRINFLAALGLPYPTHNSLADALGNGMDLLKRDQTATGNDLSKQKTCTDATRDEMDALPSLEDLIIADRERAKKEGKNIKDDRN